MEYPQEKMLEEFTHFSHYCHEEFERAELQGIETGATCQRFSKNINGFNVSHIFVHMTSRAHGTTKTNLFRAERLWLDENNNPIRYEVARELPVYSEGGKKRIEIVWDAK